MSTVHFEGDYCETILEKLWQKCENEDLSDVVLIAGPSEKRIPAHRLILSVASDYFRGMFSSSMRESTKKEIELPSVDGNILRSLVEYCYKGRVVISEDIVVEMLKTADMLLLPNVVTACENFLEDRLQSSNCLGLAIFAEQYSFETLLQKANDYSLGYYSDVCKTDEFFSLNADQLSQLLESDELYVSAEEEVFKSVIQWIGHAPHEREKYKEELLRLVRIPLLERSFLDEQVKPICTSAECLKLYVEAVESQLLSDRKKVTPRNSTRGDEFLLAVTNDEELKEININYFCPEQLKWMKWLKHLECHDISLVTVLAEHVYIAGGFEPYKKTGIYLNLRTMSSRRISPMKDSRVGSRVIALKEFLYVIGGLGKSSAEKWNPNTNSWSNIASMSTERYHFVTIILNTKIYVLGGMSENNSSLSSAEFFDPDKNVWTNIASMSTARIGFGISILDEKIYVVGGRSNNMALDVLNTANYYDPNKNVWTDIACMNRHRFFPSVAVLSGLLYVVGGVRGEKTVERYDPKTNNWAMICDFNKYDFPSIHECIIYRNKVVVCNTDRYEEYDPETNEWKAAPTLNDATIKNIKSMFSYSGNLLSSEFVDN